MKTFLMDKQSVTFAETLGKPFLALPKPPKFFIQIIVTVIPWLALLIAVVSILATLGLLPALFTLNNYITQISGQPGINDWNAMVLIPSFIFTLLVGILYLFAFNPLRKRMLKGWMYLFWGNMIGLVSSLWFSIADRQFSIFNIAGIIVGMYVMYQIKAEYRK